MTTALQLIEDAFDDLEVKSSEIDLETDEIDLAIRRLNRMMTNWAQGGLNLGYSKVSDSSDVLTVPDWAEEAITAHLAIRLAPGFGKTINAALAAFALEAMDTMTRNLVQMGEISFPNTLPIGSGNYQGDNTRYFTDGTDGDLQTDSKSDITNDEGIQLSED